MPSFIHDPISARRRVALQRLEERVARAVCSVHGIVTREENERLDELREIVGQKWNASDQRWEELDA